AGLGGPDPLAMDPIVPQEMLNSLDYYKPARSLIVRGSSRMHARLQGGLLGGPKGGPPAGGAAMGALGPNRDGPLVIKPNKDNPKDSPKRTTAVAKAPDKGANPAQVAWVEPDAKKVWEDAIVKLLSEENADKTGLVIATADFLIEKKKYNHCAEFLK